MGFILLGTVKVMLEGSTRMHSADPVLFGCCFMQWRDVQRIAYLQSCSARSVQSVGVDGSGTGVGNSNGQQVVLAYRQLNGEVLVGAPQLIRYNKAIGTVLRAEGQVDETSVCSGAIGDIRLIGDLHCCRRRSHPQPNAF